MKKLDSRTLRYIAKAYGKNYAEGDEVAAPSSEDSSGGASGDWNDTPPAGFDGSPQANPNVAITSDTLAQANMAPSDVNVPAEANVEVPPETAAPTPIPPQQDQAQNQKVESDFQKAGVPDIEGALQEEKSANVAGAKAQADQGQAEADSLKAASEAIAKLPSANEITQAYKAKDDALYKAYADKKLDPQRYVHSLSTGQKILSGIALIIGGAGAGASRQPNLAAKMIDDSINRDIDAQKNSQDQSMNLWKMNKEEYGNDLAANLATQNQLLTGTKLQLAQAASNAKGPIAQASAQAANALIDQKMAENRFKLSLMKPTSDSFGLDPAKKVQFLVPAEKQAKVFDEIDAAQNTARNAPAILKAFDDAANSVHAMDFVPGIDNADQKALHAMLGPTFKDVEGTVRQAAMDNMFKNTTPQDFDDKRTTAIKRNALINYMTAKSSAPNASGFGINLGEYPSTNVKGSIPPVPGKKPAPPETKETPQYPGVKYQKVQGGWKKVQ